MDVLDPEDEDDAGMIDMLWAIINAQNYQNHNMEAYLDAKGLPAIGASPAPESPRAPSSSAARWRPKLTRPRIHAGEAQCSGDSAMWHKNGETASEKGCAWVAMFPEKRRRPCEKINDATHAPLILISTQAASSRAAWTWARRAPKARTAPPRSTRPATGV